MKKVEKNILVLHSAEQMFELVDKVEDYPKFLPWYSKTEVIERKNNAESRRRLQVSGPKRTLEDLYIQFIFEEGLSDT